MNNPCLNSEAFDRAAYNLASAMRDFNTGKFDESVRTFDRSVDRLAAVLGMQAENDQRKHLGQSMAYTNSDFTSA